MRILKHGDAIPAHMLFTDQPRDLWKILSPEINLVALPIRPCAAFNEFALDAKARELKALTTFSCAYANEDLSIGQQLTLIEGDLRKKYDRMTGGPLVSSLVRDFASDFCRITNAEELGIRQTGWLGEETMDMRPHIDALAEIRGLIDLSDVGMVAFDQTGLSVSDRRAIANAANEGPAAAAQIYRELDDRVIRFTGPVMMLFKGLQSDNPLLHAAVPAQYFTPEQKERGFRPCWRVDSYYR